MPSAIRAIVRAYRDPSLREVLARQLDEAQLSLLEAARQREYWSAMEDMFVERVGRLRTELSVVALAEQNARKGGSPTP